MFSVIPNVTITPTAPAPAPLIEGRDALVLDCEVDSNPAPAISWYKDIQTDGSGVPRLQVTSVMTGQVSSLTIIHSQEISRGAQLRMETVSRHDAGLYSCIASNIIGEGDRVDIEIDVHCKLPDLLLTLLLASVSLSVLHGPADIRVTPARGLLLPPASPGPS